MKTMIVTVCSLLGSTVLASPSQYLKCYNAIRAPLPAVSVFGVPKVEEESAIGGVRAPGIYNSALQESAYLVTAKTILVQNFNSRSAQFVRRESQPGRGGQVKITGSPFYEVDAKKTDSLKKTYIRAYWTEYNDHPTGARLSVEAVPTQSVRGQIEKIGTQIEISAKPKSQIIQHLKDQITDAIHLNQGSSAVYSQCHAIPELKEFLESRVNFFRPGPGHDSSAVKNQVDKMSTK